MKFLVLLLFTIGWLVPAALGVHATLGAIRALENPDRVNSFPFTKFAGESFAVAGVWLAVAIAFWLTKLRRQTEKRTAAV